MSLALAVPVARQEIDRGNNIFKGSRRPLNFKANFSNKEIYGEK